MARVSGFASSDRGRSCRPYRRAVGVGDGLRRWRCRRLGLRDNWLRPGLRGRSRSVTRGSHERSLFLSIAEAHTLTLSQIHPMKLSSLPNSFPSVSSAWRVTLHREPGQEALARYSRWTDGPLMVLAVLMIPVLLGPLLIRIPESWEGIFGAADWFIWGIFAVDYFVRLYLSPARWRYVRTHVPDLVIVVIPFLRPLRILRSARVLRLLRLGRVAAFLARAFRDVGRILSTRGVNYVLLVVVALVFLSAAMMVEFERGMEEANIRTFADGLWWAATTITTVGYGDRFPTSMAGRGIAVVLMIAGIALFRVLTAAIAAFL
jgi:voltage-gated potassium channel